MPHKVKQNNLQKSTLEGKGWSHLNLKVYKNQIKNKVEYVDSGAFWVARLRK